MVALVDLPICQQALAFQECISEAGERRRVRFALDARDLSLVNEAGEHIVAPGDYLIRVGGSRRRTAG